MKDIHYKKKIIKLYAKKTAEANVANAMEMHVLHVMLGLKLKMENASLLIVMIPVNSVLKEHTSRLQQEI